jgi:hypothetical protein
MHLLLPLTNLVHFVLPTKLLTSPLQTFLETFPQLTFHLQALSQQLLLVTSGKACNKTYLLKY